MSVGTTIDRVIGVFSPKQALSRAVDRRRLEVMSTYAAAAPGRMGRDAPRASKTADQAILPDLQTMTARSRAAVRDTSHASAIRRSFRRNVVGLGITPTFAARRPDGELDDEFNESMLDLWNTWASNPRMVDIEKKNSFRGKQAMVVGEMTEVGEHFTVMSYRRRDHAVGLVLQSFEPEQLDLSVNRNVKNGNEIRHGIEVDRFGAAVAYHFRKIIDGDWRIDDTIRVPASRVSHTAEIDRVRQTHGVSRLAPVLNRIASVGRYEEAMMMGAIMEACIGLIDKSGVTGDNELIQGLKSPEGSDGVDADGNQEIEFQPGMVVSGDYESFVPSRPNGIFGEYMMHQARGIGAGAGVSYEQVMRDFTQGTYSSQRQGALEDWAEFDCVGGLVIEQFCNRIVREFIRLAVAEGRLAMPVGWQTHRENYYIVDWQGPARPWIDPLKEMKAAESELENLTNTHEWILNRRGRTLRAALMSKKKAVDMANEIGVEVAGLNAPSAARIVEAKSDDEEDDDAGGKKSGVVARIGGIS